MRLKHEFNRITHLFSDGVHNSEKKTNHWFQKGTCGASAIDRRLREQARASQRNLMTAEEAVVRHVRANPSLYLIGAAVLVGVLIARLVLEAQRTPRAPLL